MPYVCKFCKGRFCAAHRLPENHSCAGLGVYREKVREQGRVFQSDPLVRPVVSRPARTRASMDAMWARLDGKMTYIFLGVIVAFYLAELLVLYTAGAEAFENTFVIHNGFWLRPWTILTSIFSHDPSNPSHLFFNALALLFFGATVERLIGTKRYTLLFLAAGALAGIAEVAIMSAMGRDVGALGASGALQGLMGTLVVLAPTLTVLVFFVVPAPLWALVILYVLLDIVGVITPGSPIAHFAHLAGLAVGIAFGFHLRSRGLRAQVQPREPPLRRGF